MTEGNDPSSVALRRVERVEGKEGGRGLDSKAQRAESGANVAIGARR
jgi:hypothetical protein